MMRRSGGKCVVLAAMVRLIPGKEKIWNNPYIIIKLKWEKRQALGCRKNILKKVKLGVDNT